MLSVSGGIFSNPSHCCPSLLWWATLLFPPRLPGWPLAPTLICSPGVWQHKAGLAKLPPVLLLCCNSPGSSFPRDPVASWCSAAPARPFREHRCRAGPGDRSHEEAVKDRRSKFPSYIFTFHIIHGIKAVKIKATVCCPAVTTERQVHLQEHWRDIPQESFLWN